MRGRLGLLALLLCLGLAACGDGDGPRPLPGAYDADGRAFGAARRPAGAPNLLVILIDTLRADALEARGGARPTMPYLAALASRGVTFADATAPAPWTMPSIASFLTGLLPSAHGADDVRRPPHLPAAIPTFAEVLRNTYGYQTAAFVGGPWFGEASNLLQGFEQGVDDFALQGTEPVVGAWAKRRDPNRPFFLFLHTFEAHDAYGRKNHPWPPRAEDAPLPERPDLDGLTSARDFTRVFLLDNEGRLVLGRRLQRAYLDTVVHYMHVGFGAEPDPALAAELEGAYEEGLSWVDGLLEETVRLLGAWGLLENTLLVVTGDHGEAFGEHGILGHGRQLYDELVRVPLVLRGPGPFETPRVVAGGAGLVDVLPTFFDLAGLVPPRGIEGRSLLPLLGGEEAGHVVLSEERLSRANTGEDVETVLLSARSPRWKYVVRYDQRRGEVAEELYDLAADPLERSDLARDGRVPAPAPFDGAFCDAVERLRDRVWGRVADAEGRLDTPYGAGVVRVRTARPPACR